MWYLIFSVIVFFIFISLIIILLRLPKANTNDDRDNDKIRKEKTYSVIGLAVMASTFVIVTLFNSVIIVQPGQVTFTKLFGKMQYEIYESGTHLINPFLDTMNSSILRSSIDYLGENTADGLTSNRVMLNIDVTVPYMLNPIAAPKLRERYGEYANLVTPSSRSAIRDCISKLEWEEAVGEDGRVWMASCIPEETKKLVVADLMQSGFDKNLAESAFSFPPALVRKMALVDKTILASVAQELAAVIDLRRQDTLTAIAKTEAERRENEGEGIQKMMGKLPKDFTVEQMVAIINANANKIAADALMKSVESGNPNLNVVIGGSNNTAIPLKK